eukprot:3597652-Amphidinium_carterae.1
MRHEPKLVPGEAVGHAPPQPKKQSRSHNTAVQKPRSCSEPQATAPHGTHSRHGFPYCVTQGA